MNIAVMDELQLVIISGLPVTGKSTLAARLGEKLHLPVFSVDPIESSIIKSGIERSFETGLAGYLVAETLASEQLGHGLSVIIDAVCPVRESREMWRVLSNRHRARLVIIECVVNRGVHRERVESRVRALHGIPEITWEDVENRRRDYQTWEDERLVMDTSDEVEDHIEKALNYLKASN